MELWSLIRALRQAADPEAHTLGENTHWFVHFAYGSSLSLFLSAPVVRAETCCDKDTHKCRWSMQQKSLMFPVQSGLLSATLVRPSAHINIACWYLYECLCSIPAHICRVVDGEGFLKKLYSPFFPALPTSPSFFPDFSALICLTASPLILSLPGSFPPCCIFLSSSSPLPMLFYPSIFLSFSPSPGSSPSLVCCVFQRKMKPNKLEPQEGDWWLRKALSLHLFPFLPVFIPTLPPYLPLVSPTGTVALSHTHTHNTHRSKHTRFV